MLNKFQRFCDEFPRGMKLQIKKAPSLLSTEENITVLSTCNTRDATLISFHEKYRRSCGQHYVEQFESHMFLKFCLQEVYNDKQFDNVLVLVLKRILYRFS